MKGLIYLARKDAIYHILRFSIHGFTKVLEGLRGEAWEGQDYYLKFCSCFLVDLGVLMFHGSRAVYDYLVPAIPSTRHVKVPLLLFMVLGAKPQP